MPIQQADLKNGDEKAEETAPETDNLAGNKAGDTDAMENSAQIDGQNTLVEDDSTKEDRASIVDEAAESLDSATNDGKTPDSAENTADDNNDSPDKTDLDQEATGLEAKSAELEAKSIDLAAQLAEARDQLLRKAADFENFRKRMNQEKQSAIEFANQTLLLDIIPIIDDFERAIQSAEASAELIDLPAGKALLDGIAMIEKRLTGQLESKWGLKRFNSAGELFDPNRHEAMMMEKSSSISDAIVQEDFMKGYTLKNRVIRAAKVKVLMPEEGE
jgi:molecular chaperone GrpE